VVILRKVKPDQLNHLGKLREETGLSREQVAEELGCTVQLLGQIEKKGTKQKPRPDKAWKLCDLYDCKLEDIYPRESMVKRGA
jgi:DNA-binding XRE family transcriptional regulator